MAAAKQEKLLTGAATRKIKAKEYGQMEKEKVQGSPFYQPYFGKVMTLQINGVGVYVPLDGQPYEIPKIFADLFRTRIARVDAQIQKLGNGVMLESYAGEVK